MIADGMSGRRRAGATGNAGGATAAAADTGAANQPVAGVEGGGQVGGQQTDQGDEQPIIIVGHRGAASAIAQTGDAETAVAETTTNSDPVDAGSPIGWSTDAEMSGLILGLGYQPKMGLQRFVAANYLNIAPGRDGALDTQILRENQNNPWRLEDVTNVVEGWAQSNSAFTPYASSLRSVVDNGLATFQNDWNRQVRDFGMLYAKEAATEAIGDVAGKVALKVAIKAAPYIGRILLPAVDYLSPAAQRLIARGRLPAETLQALGPRPAGMINPHRHHILSLNGTAGAERALVREGQDILRGVGIDPVNGVENLVWAPNKGHTFAATETLVNDLRAASAAGASRSRIEQILKMYGQTAAGR